MDPVVAQRLRKFGTENMLAFYLDSCEELLKYPTLSLGEVMCVFATLTTHQERDEALWCLAHKEEVPTASKKGSVKSRLTMPPPPSPSLCPSPKSSPSPSKRHHQNDDLGGIPPKKVRKEIPIKLSSCHPHLKLNGLNFYLCGDSQMVRFSEYLGFETERDQYSMKFCGPLCRSGSKISEVINRVRQIETPENLVVLVGINNVTRDRNGKEKAHFKTLMRELGMHSKHTIVLTIPLLKNIPSNHPSNVRVEELNNQLLHEDRYKNVKTLDISEMDNDEGNFRSDGVHINEAGFQFLQQYLESLVVGPGDDGHANDSDSDTDLIDL